MPDLTVRLVVGFKVSLKLAKKLFGKRMPAKYKRTKTAAGIVKDCIQSSHYVFSFPPYSYSDLDGLDESHPFANYCGDYIGLMNGLGVVLGFNCFWVFVDQDDDVVYICSKDIKEIGGEHEPYNTDVCISADLSVSSVLKNLSVFELAEKKLKAMGLNPSELSVFSVPN